MPGREECSLGLSDAEGHGFNHHTYSLTHSSRRSGAAIVIIPMTPRPPWRSQSL